ncbi:MAG: hypothetical protein J6R44_00970 [Clostridia bacterium]|nr:hypothetical protein [Clostridia bacterium]
MAKVIDTIIFTLSFFVVAYGLLSGVMPKNLAIILTSVGYVILLTIFIFINMRRKVIVKDMSADEMPTYLALMDREKQTELFYNLVKTDNRVLISSPYFIYRHDNKLILVAVLYRFINLTQEDIASAYRFGAREGVNEIIILTRARERKTITLTAILPIRFTFPSKYAVWKELKKHNALPPKPTKPTRQKITYDKSLILSRLFSNQKSRLYLFLSLIFAFLSLLTPLKTYYLISACVMILLAIACKLVKN